MTGSPRDVLAEGQREPAGMLLVGRRVEQLAQIDGLGLAVRQFDADHGAPGHDRDAHRDRAHRAGDVVGEADDARRLDARRRLQLVQRHDRPRAHLHDLAAHAEILEHGLEHAGVLVAAPPRRPPRCVPPAPWSAIRATAAPAPASESQVERRPRFLVGPPPPGTAGFRPRQHQPHQPAARLRLRRRLASTLSDGGGAAGRIGAARSAARAAAAAGSRPSGPAGPAHPRRRHRRAVGRLGVLPRVRAAAPPRPHQAMPPSAAEPRPDATPAGRRRGPRRCRAARQSPGRQPDDRQQQRRRPAPPPPSPAAAPARRARPARPDPAAASRPRRRPRPAPRRRAGPRKAAAPRASASGSSSSSLRSGRRIGRCSSSRNAQPSITAGTR